MIVLTDKHRELLAKYMPDYEKYDDFGDFLLALDEVMLESLDENYEGTDETTIIARLYDRIFYLNKYGEHYEL